MTPFPSQAVPRMGLVPDTNHDGRVTEAEFLAWYNAKYSEAPLDQEWEDEVLETDGNGDGFVGNDEFDLYLDQRREYACAGPSSLPSQP